MNKTLDIQVEPMLLKDKQLAAVLNISTAHVHSLDNAGKIPKPVKLGASKRWITSEIRAWTNANCPNRIEWNIQNNKT